MTLALAHLRRALERGLTTNPTLLRLPEQERTVGGLAWAYLPREVFAFIDDEAAPHHPPGLAYSPPGVLRRPLDLTDPGTVHAVLVALALALGLDPGVMGVGASWGRFGAKAWWLEGDSDAAIFVSEGASASSWRVVMAPAVAMEPDPINALTLALLHVLEAP